jgi:hypothetical protein
MNEQEVNLAPAWVTGGHEVGVAGGAVGGGVVLEVEKKGEHLSDGALADSWLFARPQLTEPMHTVGRLSAHLFRSRVKSLCSSSSCKRRNR